MHDAWEALLQVNANSPKLFRRGGTLVRLATDRELASIETVTKEWLFTWLAAWADWIKLTPWGEQPTKPDKDVVRSILEAPSKRLPRIDIVTHAPFFARGGELIAAHGYHSSESTYLAPPEGWLMADVSSKPAPSQTAAARELLHELICDFPFVSAADRAHIFSALLTPFIRRIVNGPVPLHLVEAPTPGTGKSMLCQVVSIVAQGTKVAASVFSQSKEEQRKVIFAVLLQAPSVVLLDNVDSDDRTGRLESDVLAAVLTGR
jgi:putative DNA primase/helicase